MRNQPGLMHQLMRELVVYDDLPLAAACAKKYSIPFEDLPAAVQSHILAQGHSHNTKSQVVGHGKHVPGRGRCYEGSKRPSRPSTNEQGQPQDLYKGSEEQQWYFPYI